MEDANIIEEADRELYVDLTKDRHANQHLMNIGSIDRSRHDQNRGGITVTLVPAETNVTRWELKHYISDFRLYNIHPDYGSTFIINILQVTAGANPIFAMSLTPGCYMSPRELADEFILQITPNLGPNITLSYEDKLRRLFVQIVPGSGAHILIASASNPLWITLAPQVDTYAKRRTPLLMFGFGAETTDSGAIVDTLITTDRLLSTNGAISSLPPFSNLFLNIEEVGAKSSAVTQLRGTFSIPMTPSISMQFNFSPVTFVQSGVPYLEYAQERTFKQEVIVDNFSAATQRLKVSLVTSRGTYPYGISEWNAVIGISNIRKYY